MSQPCRAEVEADFREYARGECIKYYIEEHGSDHPSEEEIEMFIQDWIDNGDFDPPEYCDYEEE